MLGILDKTQGLLRAELFGGLSFEDLTTISRIASPVAFPGGAVIFRQGDPGDCLYVVLEGGVSIILFN